MRFFCFCQCLCISCVAQDNSSSSSVAQGCQKFGHPCNQKVASSTPGQYTYLGFGLAPQSGCVWEATNPCFSLFLPSRLSKSMNMSSNENFKNYMNSPEPQTLIPGSSTALEKQWNIVIKAYALVLKISINIQFINLNSIDLLKMDSLKFKLFFPCQISPFRRF